MTDLVILVPSRGRPQNVARLVEACNRTCRAKTLIAFGFDEDDPAYVDNLRNADGCSTSVRPRMHLGAWTNELAALHMDVPYLCSMGDDMVPVTDGWDEMLLEAQRVMGGGFSYPDDKRRDDVPECCVIDRRIVSALGWMCEPSIGHWYTDNVWRDLGTLSGRFAYVPGAVVEHRHPNVPGGDPPDQTYTDAAGKFNEDLAAYQRWRIHRMRQDVARVRGCLG